MSEKRLEKIEKDKAMSNDDVVIKEDDYNWFIEQVEQNEQRNKKLSEVHSYLQEVNLVDDDVIYWGNNVIDVLLSYSKELEEQNKSYREASEFGVKYLKNSDIKQVQLVVEYLEAVLNND